MVALFVAGLYIALVLNEDVVSDDQRSTAFIGTALIATSLLGIFGSIVRRAFARRVLLTGAATAMTAWGVIAILSIGMPLLLAAGLTWLAVVRAAAAKEAAIASGAAAVVALAVTLVGLALV